ncbi:MAG: glycosyltransferase family 2 protein [Fimbriimonadaceae bacterium]|nr:glycosyltransferase family 2 protein [Fimbriimonadaceae bacterium]
MDLRVVIVNYNTRDLLDRCLTSLAQHPPPGRCEIVVVDNASRDGSVAMLRARHPAVRVIASRRNLGFAGGNNLALRNAAAEAVLLLNSDTTVRAGALRALLEQLAEHPAVGVVGPRLILPDGSVQASCFAPPTLARWAAAQFNLDRLPALARWLGQPAAAALTTPTAVGWLTGAALLVRGSALQQVGPLPTDYFMYWEDVDWCRRFAAAGWELRYLPSAVIDHHHGASSQHARGAMIAANNRGAGRYFHHWQGAAAGLLALAIGLLGAGGRWVVWSLLASCGRPDAARRRELFRVALAQTWREPRP